MLKTVALYHLTKTFASSVYIYYSNPAGFMTTYTKANTDAPMLFSAFKYNVGFWPPELVGRVGNLVSYKSECSFRPGVCFIRLMLLLRSRVWWTLPGP